MIDRNESYYPQVCVRCGSWMHWSAGKNPTDCAECGHANSMYSEFYRGCMAVERMLNADARAVDRIRPLLLERTTIAHGASPEILALISAYVLGMLTNASYDAIKAWIVSRRNEYGAKCGGMFAFEPVVEATLEFMIDHMDEIKRIKFIDDEVMVQFKRDAKKLRSRIEDDQSLDRESCDALGDDA